MLPGLFLLALLLSSQDSEPHPAAVLFEADAAFFRDTREHGLEGWLAPFAEDAIVFPDSGDLIQGSAELRRHYTALHFPPAGFVWEPLEAGLSAAGDFGWTTGRWGNDGSGSAVWTGRYLTVWRLSQTGKWEVVADCGGEPTFLARFKGLGAAPASMGRETLHTFRSPPGDLQASMGAWWVSDADGGETGGKFLSVWKLHPDGTLELVAETGFPQAKR